MQGRFPECSINQGEKALIGDLELNQKVISEYASEHGNQCFLLELYIHDVTFNTWKIYVYGKMEEEDCFEENNFEEVDDSFSYTRSELYLSKEDAKKVLKRRYLIKAIEKSLHDMSWSTFDGISDQALQNLHTALIAVEKERIVLKK